jgi:hypothetical protein
MTRKLVVLILFLTAIITTTAGAAVFLIPSDDHMIDDSVAIVIARAQPGSYATRALNGDIDTVTTFVPERVLKGNGIIMLDQPFTVRDMGGTMADAAMGVSGGVTYEPDERVLLFLARDSEGFLTTWGMLLGKFNFGVDGQAQNVLFRAMAAEAIGINADGTPHLDPARARDGFLTYIAQRVGGGRRRRSMSMPPPTYGTAPYVIADAKDITTDKATYNAGPHGFRMTTNSAYAPNAYTQGSFRWKAFDDGATVTYRVSGTQPGYDAIGASQRALAAWTNDPRSNVRLAYGGTTTTGFVQDSVNSMVFNSSTDVPAGAIGYSKWYSSGSHVFNGITWYTTVEGDTVMRSGLTISQSAFDEAVTHEVGHTLGFRHSDQGTPTSTQAVMNSVVSGNYGANLQGWDQEAVNAVYGDNTFIAGQTTTCVAPSVATQPASQTLQYGQSTSLSVGVSGTAPFTYQWYVGTSGTTTQPIASSNTPAISVGPTTTTKYWVRITNSCGTINSVTATITVVGAPVYGVRGDFNHDGNPDLMWRNRSTGQDRLWLMNGSALTTMTLLPTEADQNWVIGGAGDFNGDGEIDIVLRNQVTGQDAVWLMSGTAWASTASFQNAPVTAWRIRSVVDWNHDGWPDVILHNESTGGTVIWFMRGTAIVSTYWFPTLSDLAWDVAGSGDFNADGNVDIVLRHRTNGQVAIWQFNGSSQLIATIALPTMPDQNWQIGAVADYNRDGTEDIVWRNRVSGAVELWLIRNVNYFNSVAMPPEPDVNWELVGPK